MPKPPSSPEPTGVAAVPLSRLVIAAAAAFVVLLVALAVVVTLLLANTSTPVAPTNTTSATKTPSTATAAAKPSVPKLSAPLDRQQVKALATGRITTLAWLGAAPVGGQLRANTATKGAVELDYVEGAALAKFTLAKPTFTYLVDSVPASNANIVQLEGQVSRSSRTVKLGNGLTGFLPPSTAPQTVAIIISRNYHLAARLTLSAPAQSSAALEAVTRLVTLLHR